MSATQGFIVSGLALLFGVAALVFAQTWWWERSASRLTVIFLGVALCVGGIVWLLLSIAAYRGDS
jgi:hypothetical protein